MSVDVCAWRVPACLSVCLGVGVSVCGQLSAMSLMSDTPGEMSYS